MFTITIIFCRHVTNVTNVTSRYTISPIIFTITIIFFRHVTNITSCYKISSILGCRAPLDAIISSRYKISSILGYRVPLDTIVLRRIKSLRRYTLIRFKPKDTSFYLRSTYNILLLIFNIIYGPHIIFFITFYFVMN